MIATAIHRLRMDESAPGRRIDCHLDDVASGVDWPVRTGGLEMNILDRPTVSLKEGGMSVAKVSEISATSSKSFEDALQQGIARASKTLRNVRGAWIKEQHVHCDNGKIVEYRVNMMVTFVLDD
jgi:flavin-binding protein dodecin